MGNDVIGRWPRFELVRFEAPTGIPNGWDAELLEKGVPKDMVQRCKASSALRLLEDPNRGPIVRFMNVNSFYGLCLDPRTGHVVDVVHSDMKQDKPIVVYRSARIANSSLDRFIASVRAVIQRFPFDEGVAIKNHRLTDDELNEHRRLLPLAVEELRSTLTNIDPAGLEDGELGVFWAVFLDDILMGNFATADDLWDETYSA